jgi:hypothetical protein
MSALHGRSVEIGRWDRRLRASRKQNEHRAKGRRRGRRRRGACRAAPGKHERAVSSREGSEGSPVRITPLPFLLVDLLLLLSTSTGSADGSRE